jgi:hypothetical protein
MDEEFKEQEEDIKQEKKGKSAKMVSDNLKFGKNKSNIAKLF